MLARSVGILTRIKQLARGKAPDDRSNQAAPAAAAAPKPETVLLGDPDQDAQIYGRDSCPYTGRARRLLQEQGLDPSYIDLDSPPHHRLVPLLAAQTRQSTVPYVFVRGRFVGGFDELAEQTKLGQLERTSADRVAVLAPTIEPDTRPAPLLELHPSVDTLPNPARHRRPETHKPASPMKLMELGLAVEEEAEGELVSVELIEDVADDEGVPVALVFAGAALIPGLNHERASDVRFEVCTGQCQSWGALERLKQLVALRLGAQGERKASFDVVPVECLDRCDKAPVMIVHTPEGVAALDRVEELELRAAVDQLCRR